MNVLLTGGMGYIGSHTALRLIEQGHQVTIFDNLTNSNASVLNSIQSISLTKPNFVQGDILDTAIVENTLNKFKINAVIHLAGLKAVGESVLTPLSYYKNNVQGTISLLDAMLSCNIGTLVFSSSATVYGAPTHLPITEEHPTDPNNPYGRTKLYIEKILMDTAQSNKDWNVINLRYFNPVGSHPSGLIGDSPNGIPNNLVPYVAQTAAGKRDQLTINGGDYNTSDGTCIRDYIHVSDLADAHVKAFKFLQKETGNLHVFNVGTGTGSTVLEVVSAFEKATKMKVKYAIGPRREGDAVSVFADNSKIVNELNWTPKFSLEEALSHAWKWQQSLSD